MMRYVRLPAGGEVPPAREIGGKAHNLARLAAVPGVRVPPWFVISADAFDDLVLRDAAGASGVTLRARVSGLALPPGLADALRTALASRSLLGSLVAVRSSATAEDAAAASFAGQFASVLAVPATHDLDLLWDAVQTVWASAFSDHARAYADGQLDSAAIRMAVVVQALAPARTAGVAFSVDPVTGDASTAVVSAVYGLGETLVSGDADADTHHVTFSGEEVAAVRHAIVRKDHALVRRSTGGTQRIDVPAALATAPALGEAQVVDIARAARALAQALGAPQDIEWAIGDPGAGDAGEAERLETQAGELLYILQARPVTAAGPTKTGERRIWDNSNIVESYSGVTTPLTFSFARGVYEQVYRQFCDVLGVRPAVIEAHRDVFANMLGLIRGRVYYNLLNWYRVLALLPGYAVNREFMERMMGVRERLADPPPPPGAGERSRDLGRLLRSAGRLWREHRRLDGEIARFFARVNSALAPIEGADLDTWSADDLVALYRRLDAELLTHWRSPLVNDFFAMIWFGILGRLVERWLPDAAPTIVNDLLVGEGGIISTEPARRIMALASIATADPVLVALLASEPSDAVVLERVRSDAAHAPFARELDAYLARFGDRCIGELKLETITPSEDPAFVIRMTRAYVQQGQTDAARGTSDEQAVRRRAEAFVRSQIAGTRRRTFGFVLQQARARIRDRENLRFERTRVFGAVRRIFRGLGIRLHEEGRLTSPRDVFHLTVDEIFAAVAGTGMTHDLSAVASARRAEFERYEQEPSPPERFETRGPPDAPPPRAATAVGGDGDLRGLGCCPGIVRAPVRVVRDPSTAGNLDGHILVAERTDPGWTLLFPTASGLLVQRGSLLSHSAIVAREIGLPCIVGIPELMTGVRDGEWVEMDGTTGVVIRIPAPVDAAAVS